MNRWTISELDGAAATAAVPALAGILIDCVEGGASVSFLAPLALSKAEQFWHGVAAGVGRGERALLVARDPEGVIRGTVQIVLAQPENQPHRADVVKLLVHRSARKAGAGEELMRAVDDVALARGKTLLVLDTASAEAERVYRRLGWTMCGVIPRYALNPDGTPCDTVVYWKSLA